jgi:hypothetical protein
MDNISLFDFNFGLCETLRGWFYGQGLAVPGGRVGCAVAFGAWRKRK